MMKKIIATGLCLTLTTPCFAAGRFDNHPQNPPQNMPQKECRFNQPDYYGGQPHRRHASATTKTLATVAGVAGVAALISAIVD
jgi:hypothetical protein